MPDWIQADWFLAILAGVIISVVVTFAGRIQNKKKGSNHRSKYGIRPRHFAYFFVCYGFIALMSKVSLFFMDTEGLFGLWLGFTIPLGLTIGIILGTPLREADKNWDWVS